MEPIIGPAPRLAGYASHLPYPALQRLVGQALLDPDFCASLLNGSRAELVAQADFLSEDERVFLMGIRAENLGEFAKAIMLRYPSIGSGPGGPLQEGPE